MRKALLTAGAVGLTTVGVPAVTVGVMARREPHLF